MTRTPRPSGVALTTDSELQDFIASLVGHANSHRFWMIFLDEFQRPLRDIMPVDGLPDRPEPDDAERMVPMFCGCYDALDAHAMVLVIERRGQRAVTDDDRLWARTLHAGAALAGVELRALLLAHSTGVRWLALDDYLL